MADVESGRTPAMKKIRHARQALSSQNWPAGRKAFPPLTNQLHQILGDTTAARITRRLVKLCNFTDDVGYL